MRYRDTRGRWIARASAASTRREARRLARDLELLGKRVRLAVEAAPGKAQARTVADILAWWQGAFAVLDAAADERLAVLPAADALAARRRPGAHGGRAVGRGGAGGT